jgi:hypothetical protein
MKIDGKKLNPFISTLFRAPLSLYPKLLHVKALDMSMMSPGQWRTYYQTNKCVTGMNWFLIDSSSHVLGSELTRRYCMFVNRFIFEKWNFKHGLTSNGSVVVMDLELQKFVIYLMIRAVEENYEVRTGMFTLSQIFVLIDRQAAQSRRCDG